MGSTAMGRFWLSCQRSFQSNAARGCRRRALTRPPAGLLLAAGFLLSLSLFSPVYASDYPEAHLLGYTFTFDGKTYDPVRDESTWHYTVTGPMVSGPTYKDLSHWILALCTPHVVVEASGNKWERRTKPDPHHGLIGIKWDDKVDKQGSASFYFVLKGDWGIDYSVAVAAKAGQGLESGLLPGPACQADSCRIDYEVTARNDWRFLKPGTYAASVMQIHLHGSSGVLLAFDSFSEAVEPHQWGEGPAIHFEYSLGRTLEEASDRGWLPATVFNKEEVIVDKAAVTQGVRLTVWARAVVADVTRASEYRGGGTVSVQLLCD